LEYELFIMLLIELDRKAANCKQESCSCMQSHTQYDSGNKHLTFNFKFDKFVLCNKQTFSLYDILVFGKLIKFYAGFV
jgi:hypothetical protein